MTEKAKCRVCGAQFNPCKGVTGVPAEQQPFNWRKICCSPVCGTEYFRRIAESRGLNNDDPPAAKPKRQAAKKPAAEDVEP